MFKYGKDKSIYVDQKSLDFGIRTTIINYLHSYDQEVSLFEKMERCIQFEEDGKICKRKTTELIGELLKGYTEFFNRNVSCHSEEKQQGIHVGWCSDVLAKLGLEDLQKIALDDACMFCGCSDIYSIWLDMKSTQKLCNLLQSVDFSLFGETYRMEIYTKLYKVTYLYLWCCKHLFVKDIDSENGNTKRIISMFKKYEKLTTTIKCKKTAADRERENKEMQRFIKRNI